MVFLKEKRYAFDSVNFGWDKCGYFWAIDLKQGLNAYGNWTENQNDCEKRDKSHAMPKQIDESGLDI